MILPLLVALVAQGTASAPAPSNVLTAAERAAGWRLLFDGRTLKGWRGLGYDSVPTAHWVVVDGAIKKRSEEHTSELQSQSNLVCRLLLEKKKKQHDHVVARTYTLR